MIESLLRLSKQCARAAIGRGALPMDLEDLEQEAFIAGWKARGCREAYIGFRMRGAIWDFLRTRNQHRSRLGRFMPSFVPIDCVIIAYRPPDPTLRVDVQRCLNRLRPLPKRIVIERYFKDRTEKEIGRSVGLCGSRISQIISGAKTEMRAYFDA